MTSRIGLLLILGVMLWTCPTRALADEVRRFVLVAGTNRAPEPGMAPLQFADDDAVQYHALFGRAATRSILLTVMDDDTQNRFPGLAGQTKPPTRDHLERSLEILFEAIVAAEAEGAETELYFIYSGHGRLLPGKEGAVTLEDGELTRADLYQLLLEKSPADFNHLIIDACDAYFMVHKRGDDGWRDDSSGRQRHEVRRFFDDQDLARFPSTGVILSTATEAETHEWSLYQAGVFSHEVRSGLLGPADITEDGYIEYSEIQAFVRAANHRVSDPGARLDIYVHAPVQDRNRPLLDLLSLEGAALLEMPKTAAGQYYLEDHRGIRLADFNKSGEQHLTLALLSPGTSYLRDMAGGVEYEIQSGEQRRIRFDELTPKPYDTAPRGAVERSFRAHLFTLPFGNGFYAGVIDGLEIVPARRVARAGWSVPEDHLPLSVGITDHRLTALTDWRPKAAWSTLAVGVGTLAGAGVLTYFAADSADRYRTSLNRDADYLRRRDAFSYSAIGAYTASAFCLGVSLYWFIKLRRERRAPERAGPRLEPLGSATTTGAVLGFSGRF